MTSPALSILVMGERSGSEAFPPSPDDPLVPRFGVVERRQLSLPPDRELKELGRELNEAATAAAHDWILILRAQETVPRDLADEMAAVISGDRSAWGYRIAVVPFYCGRPLRLGRPSSEVRLYHRRHCLFDVRESRRGLKVQGPVIRLRSPLRHDLFRSAAEHRTTMEREGVPHSFPRRLLLFLRDAVVTGAFVRSLSTLRYLWMRAGWDRGHGRR